jgi:hypothetical protein
MAGFRNKPRLPERAGQLAECTAIQSQVLLQFRAESRCSKKKTSGSASRVKISSAKK